VLPADIAHLLTLGTPTLSPDGRAAVVAARHPNLDDDRYDSRLWSVAVDGSSPPRQLTHGNDSAPSFAPDGRLLAFLRTEPEGKPQLFVLPTDGGDARRLTHGVVLPGGAGAPVWSPDSRSIAFAARVPDEGRYGDTPPGKEAPRRITGLQYRLDDVGFVADQRQHLFVVDVAAAGEAVVPPRQLTHGDADDADPAWSPDSQLIAFVSARHERREYDLLRDVFVVDREGGSPRRLSDESLSLGLPAFTPDGATVLALGNDHGPDRSAWVAANTGLFAIPLVGGTPQRLTDAETVHLIDSPLVVTDDAVLAGMENRGSVELVAIPFGGGAPKVLTAGPRMVTGFAAAGGTVVVSYADAGTAGELAVVCDGGLDRRTDFSAALRSTSRVRPMTELTGTAPDGYPVHGWVVTPDGDGPHPVLLMIHGGPFAQYGWALFDEAQVYAGAGFAVVYGNPRGSSGYGEAHGRYIIGDVGARSEPDLLALLDVALSRSQLDASRVGVLGGSHGGFMTSWLVGHSDRFRAAVSERAVNAIDSFTGSSDIGWGFATALYGRDLERQRLQSPLTYADRITSPLLIVHSEHDWRCPVEQAQRLYVAVKLRDAAPVELLLFPGEGHELSRSGLPSHRVARFEAITEWFTRHLCDADPVPAGPSAS
jgi:dipeptidyl aminopeptidase/acylaminoacyl peptidase